jgi:hypothetical protein
METLKRQAKTITDVADLIVDMKVKLELVEGNAIYVQFPTLPDETPSRVDDSSYKDFPQGDALRFTRQTRAVIRALVTPRFSRLTTTADQIGCYFRFHEGKTQYPNTKVIKRANEPLTIQFVDNKSCKRFWKMIKYFTS